MRVPSDSLYNFPEKVPLINLSFASVIVQCNSGVASAPTETEVQIFVASAEPSGDIKFSEFSVVPPSAASSKFCPVPKLSPSDHRLITNDSLVDAPETIIDHIPSPMLDLMADTPDVNSFC